MSDLTQTSLESSFSNSNPLLSDGTPTRAYLVRASATGTGTITMVSPSFNPVLWVVAVSADGTLGSVIVYSQLPGSRRRTRAALSLDPRQRRLVTNSHSRFFVPITSIGASPPVALPTANTTMVQFPLQSGQLYAVIANTVEPLVTGSFSLTLSSGFSKSIEEFSLSLAQPTLIQGQLTTASNQFQSGAYFVDYLCKADQTDPTAFVSMTSDTLPCYPEVHALNPDGTVATANIAVGPYYLSPRAIMGSVAVTAGATYVIRARTQVGVSPLTGPFTLILSPDFDSQVTFYIPPASRDAQAGAIPPERPHEQRDAAFGTQGNSP